LDGNFIATVLAVVFFVILAPQLAPFAPWMPNADLDPSWAWATNEAVARGLSFGRQFLLQTGPYSAIYNNFYHPETYGLMLAGGIFLAGAFALNLVSLRRENNSVSLVAAVALVLFMLAAPGSADAKFYVLTFLISLTTIRAAISNQQSAISNQQSAIRYGF
jgi:hypothetical protein